MTRRGWLLFAAMSLIWGAPYLFISIAGEYVNPFVLVLLRTGLAVLVLVPIVLVRGQARIMIQRWRPILAFALLEIIIPWPMLNYAETRISSSMAGLLIATVPLVAALAFLVSPRAERYSLRQVIGLILGFGGVVLLLGLDVDGADPLAILLMLGVVVCYTAAPLVMSRYLSDAPPLPVMTAALVMATAVYLPSAFIAPPLDVPVRGWVSIVILALVCTGLAMVLFGALIIEAAPRGRCSSPTSTPWSR
ncbi:DMT family transporter [Leucobacter soli]|uniref:DMT family transporter n=1 Tax=Leucobacter soli TaxID=2812850 RepID=UPI003606FEA4